MSAATSMYVLVWEYRVHAAHVAAIEEVYASTGDWARLFAKAEGYLGTELLRDPASAESFARFRETNAESYASLDARCEAWTESEVRIGAWTSAGS